jgi:CDP-glycerol glycerophosphotransferase (TagB/SpsB family)
MIDLLEHIDKLEELFQEKYNILAKNPDDDEFWINYCDKHDVLLMHPDWVADFFNNEKDKICISNTEKNDCPWLLVPKTFAEKVLVLGFPD